MNQPLRILIFTFALGLLTLGALARSDQPALAAPQAATYIVTRGDDPAPGGCLPTDCSLREAVLASNANPGVDVIQLAYGGVYTLTIPASGGDTAATGDLNVTDTVNFVFPDARCNVACDATIKGRAGWQDRILQIENNAQVTMSSVVIRDGNLTGDVGGGIAINSGSVLTLTFATVTHNAAGQGGGGIYNGGRLTLLSSNVSYNQTNSASNGGGGIINNGLLVLLSSSVSDNQVNSAADGGGIYSVSFSSLVTDDASISNNTAGGDGGGLEFLGDPQTSSLIYLTISHNTAGTDGGGLWSDRNGLALSNSTVVSNTAGNEGGGLMIYQGLLRIQGSTIGWNSATVAGGGLATLTSSSALDISNSALINNTSDIGGGYAEGALATSIAMTWTNVTISGNRATGSGGGLGLVDGTKFFNVSVVNNTADSDFNGTGDGGGICLDGSGQATLANTLIAGNKDEGGQSPECNGGGTLNSLGYNLIRGSNGCVITGTTTGNLLGVNPLLGLLADNGGPTWTHALDTGSPAINAGNPAGCRDGSNSLLATDQRGDLRWNRCDIGAFEFQPQRVFLPLVRR